MHLISILLSVLGGACLYLTLGLAIGVMGAWGLSELVGGFLFQGGLKNAS